MRVKRIKRVVVGLSKPSERKHERRGWKGRRVCRVRLAPGREVEEGERVGIKSKVHDIASRPCCSDRLGLSSSPLPREQQPRP